MEPALLAAPLPPASVLAVPLAAFGLIFGSFVTALSYRLPRGLSIARGRSQCPACGHVLGAADLVPVMSWAVHGGACRHCRAKVSWRYPAIELVSAALFIAAGVLAQDILHLALLLAMTPVMLTLAIIDLEHRRLPNGVVLVLAVLALGWRAAGTGDFLEAGVLAGTSVVLGLGLDALYRARTGRPGLGGGDIKLLGVIGLALPAAPFLMTLGLAGFFGVMFGAIEGGVTRDRIGQREFAFAPAVLAAFWIGLTADNALIALIGNRSG